MTAWTLISWETASLVGYDPASVQQRTAITTGSGIEYCPKLNLLRLEALGKSVSGLGTLCHTLPPTNRVDGLLGLNFLGRFNLSLNFKQRLHNYPLKGENKGKGWFLKSVK
jgi:hypothetical protein